MQILMFIISLHDDMPQISATNIAACVGVGALK